MRSPLPLRHSFLVALATLGLGAPPLPAQGIEDKLRYLVGTVHPDAAGPGQPRAYLLWQAQDPELLRGRSFALFSKAGAADAPGNYTQVATLKLLTRPAEIEAALAGNPGIVGPPAALAQSIDDLFEGLMPSAGLSLGTKLSAILLGARHDPKLYARLRLLSRVQPGVALCLGIGAAVPLAAGGPTTYELRELPATDVVAGRVTVDPANLVVLPAPGPPVEVPRTDAEGHLNARFRWGTDEFLRRLAIHQYGFNLYRMTRTAAEARGFHLTPPNPGILAQLADLNPEITRVNLLPILPPQQLTIPQAANLVGDSETFFLHDDNRRFVDGGVPFQDGDQFWYFLTARDILGRDGRSSPGTLVTIFDRMKPKAPTGVLVENFYARDPGTGNENRRLEVSWRAPKGPAPDGYRVYRWSSVPEIHQNATGDPETSAVSPLIPHVPGRDVFRFLDDGPGSPAAPTDADRTFWYTVRAYENVAAGRLYSPNSANGFGTLRERTGPAQATAAGITITAQCPTVTFGGGGFVPTPIDPGLRDGQRLANVVCNRLDTRIAWARVLHLERGSFGGGVATHLPPIVINPGDLTPPGWTVAPTRNFEAANQLAFSLAASDNGVIACIAGMTNGKQEIGFLDLANVANPPANNGYLLTFALDVAEQSETVAGGGEGSFAHDPLDPVTDEIVPIEIGFTTPPSAREWKIYRRINLGAQTLFAVGTSTGDIHVEDPELPPSGAHVCYYLQSYDEHGNPSVMQRLGCSRTLPRTGLPFPLLSPVRRSGGSANPQAILQWYCEPEGVERFQILVGVEHGLHVLGAHTDEWDFRPEVRDEIDGRRLYAFNTLSVGTGLPHDEGLFTLPLNVTAGQRFWFHVRAIGPDNTLGPLSDPAEFIWVQPPPPDPEVPWPARPLPPVDANPILEGKLAVEYIDAPARGFSGVAVRIGGFRSDPAEISLGGMSGTGGVGQRNPTSFSGSFDPSIFLYDLGPASGGAPLPCVLYRYQIPNDLYPNVSGKVVQVTPLIERLLSRTFIPPQGGGMVTALVDPFIQIFPTNPADPADFGLYLKDTFGVVSGAAYAYLLVHFKANGEIDRTIPLGALEID